MKRLHALEWEDLPWFPSSWRNFGTDYLQFIATRFDIYKPVVHLVQKGLDKSNKPHWVDLASGGGSGIIRLIKVLAPKNHGLKVTLTDYYPNVKSLEKVQKQEPGIIEFEKSSVDALHPPQDFRGNLHTLFCSFHHFKPEKARNILQNAVDTHSPIAVFEPVGKNPASWLALLFSPLQVLLLTPFIRPVRWQILPFVYILPVIPLFILWDGLVSILRTYSEKELWQLVNTLDNSTSYQWIIGKTAGHMPIQYLLGYKKENHALDK